MKLAPSSSSGSFYNPALMGIAGVQDPVFDIDTDFSQNQEWFACMIARRYSHCGCGRGFPLESLVITENF